MELRTHNVTVYLSSIRDFTRSVSICRFEVEQCRSRLYYDFTIPIKIARDKINRLIHALILKMAV